MFFGRSKTPQTPQQSLADLQKADLRRTEGKGRPTPSRKEAEARNRRPLVGAAPLREGATKEERKAAKQAHRERMAADRAKAREALVTGDERYLPSRDKGPARRFARDYVDARRNLGEYLLPGALLILLLGFIPNLAVKAATFFMLYGLMLVVIVDTFIIRRKVQRLAAEKFGDDQARGAGGYAMMRALQLRRTRLPHPMVERGQFPH
ncbi:MAG: hypothetical protein QG622_2025 [Actinomycetota bacterium]|nr:hypothetical protein [Actinomycetota bacterium]